MTEYQYPTDEQSAHNEEQDHAKAMGALRDSTFYILLTIDREGRSRVDFGTPVSGEGAATVGRVHESIAMLEAHTGWQKDMGTCSCRPGD